MDLSQKFANSVSTSYLDTPVKTGAKISLTDNQIDYNY